MNKNQNNGNKEVKATKKHPKLGDRKVIRIPFFQDEYTMLGLNPDMTYYEAVVAIRGKTGLVVAARTRNAGTSKSIFLKQFANASEEKKLAISRILEA